MTLSKKSLAAALAAVTLSATIMTSAAEARPRYRGAAIGAGIVGALALGAFAAAASPAYGYGYGYGGPVYVNDGPVRRCHLVERVNYYGDVIGHRRVCRSYY